MSYSPAKLPWEGSWIPHGTLEVGRGCNIKCPACYNNSGIPMKSMEQIENELFCLLQYRRLHTVTITGGDPSLHPRLAEIVSMIKRRSLYAAILTNGMILSEKMIDDLAGAGTDVILLHVEKGQRRPDLPVNANLSDALELAGRIASRVAARKIDVGLAMTMTLEDLPDLPVIYRAIASSEILSHLFITCHRDFFSFGKVRGSVNEGLFRIIKSETACGRGFNNLSNNAIQEQLRKEFGIEPLVYIPSSHDPGSRRWISYTVGVVSRRDDSPIMLCLKATFVEKILLKMIRLIYGRYIFFHRDKPGQFKWRILSNLLFGSRIREIARFLMASFQSGSRTMVKHFLFQEGPELEADESISICRGCPDATIRNGILIPVCLADFTEFPEGGEYE